MTRPHPFVRFQLQALRDWLWEDESKIFILVDTTDRPQDIVKEMADKEGYIHLQISPPAVRDFNYLVDGIEFKTRFKGISRQVFIEYDAIVGVTTPKFPITFSIQGVAAYSAEGNITLALMGVPLEKIMPAEDLAPKRPFLKVVK